MDAFLTVLKTGGEFTAEHVRRLQKQIAEHYPGARQICLTDDPQAPGETLPLRHGWPGWWSKLEAFEHDLGRALYLDLDVTVRGDLCWLDELSGSWAMRDAFVGGLNSSLLLWQGRLPQILNGFAAALAARPGPRGPHGRGDQGWIEERLGAWRAFPDEKVADFKRDGLGGTQPIVIFHGRPRPWQKPIFRRPRPAGEP